MVILAAGDGIPLRKHETNPELWPRRRNDHGLFDLYDAIRAGFGKVAFIIRREFADNFRSILSPN